MSYTVYAFSNDKAKILQSKTTTDDVTVAETAANYYLNQGWLVSHKKEL
jgi:hypothetical protein